MASKNIHFIAIGGAIMHYLAIDLKKNGHRVTGSDDVLFDPAKSNLANEHLLPKKLGWDEKNIHPKLDLVILGMHAKKDNVELQKAISLGLKIQSFPEYVAHQSKNKIKIVIAGSHGKTTITSMVMHILKKQNLNFDYLVGAKLKGFERMVKISQAPIIVIEGDEYLTSALDRKSKFLWYQPNILIISGIAWDHMNVFPTFEDYTNTFKKLVLENPDAQIVYYENDNHLKKIVSQAKNTTQVPYKALPFVAEENGLKIYNSTYPIYGEHNVSNLSGAIQVCKSLGIKESQALSAIKSYSGASLRLEKIFASKTSVVFRDFAHAPSKVKATVEAIKLHFSSKHILAVLELHTYSSLQKDFLTQYKGSLDGVDQKIIFIHRENLIKKGSEEKIDNPLLQSIFGKDCVICFQAKQIQTLVNKFARKNSAILLMSSGNFGGIRWEF